MASSEDLDNNSLKRKIIPGLIDVHPTECALIVNYQVQSSVNDDSPTMKSMEKVIRIKTLKPNANLTALAQEIIDKCKLIHPSRMKDVEQQLYYLQQRTLQSGHEDVDKKWLRKQFDESKTSEIEAVTMVMADIHQMDTYIEGLYEEMPDKINSTRSILQLARNPENLTSLAANEALVSALSRVLREDGKKSMELVTNIIYIFFCFSNYTHFHPMITANKMGDSCLRITDQELQRYNIWVQDLEKLEQKVAQQPQNAALIRELEQEHRKFQAILKKQDQLLFVCFHLLMNLAEDLNIEVKIVKRDIVKYLIIIMDRKTPELLILVVSFLKKLSIFKENKEEMFKNADEFIMKLGQVLSINNAPLQNLSLRLMLNVLHDENFRLAFAKKGFVQKTLDLLNNAPHPTHLLMVLQALYMFSIDEKTKPIFAFSNCIPTLIRILLDSKSEKPVQDLTLALVINLACHAKNAEIMCQDNCLKFLIKRALKNRDSLMLKLVRNIASHEGHLKMLFLDYIDDIMTLLLKSTHQPDILVELLGILGHLSIPDFDFAKLCETYKLHEFILDYLNKASQGSNASSLLPSDVQGSLSDDDDVTLEMVVLLGTMAQDEGMLDIIQSSSLLPCLMELMMKKEEDDEMILQITYLFYQLLLHPSARHYIMTQTHVVSCFIDLLYDRNKEIRQLCDKSLDIIGDMDKEWESKIKLQKFQWHNAEWLSLMSQYHRENEEEYY